MSPRCSGFGELAQKLFRVNHSNTYSGELFKSWCCVTTTHIPPREENEKSKEWAVRMKSISTLARLQSRSSGPNTWAVPWRRHRWWENDGARWQSWSSNLGRGYWSVETSSLPELQADHESKRQSREIFCMLSTLQKPLEGSSFSLQIQASYFFSSLPCNKLLLFKTGTKGKISYIPIHSIQNKLGRAVCNALPSIGLHAITAGCDTTSGLASIGKKKALKELRRLTYERSLCARVKIQDLSLLETNGWAIENGKVLPTMMTASLLELIICKIY